MSNQAPGLDEYEKSVSLTKAQYEIIKNYFNPKSNKNQEGFDDSPKRQIDFSNLMAAKKQTTAVTTPTTYVKFDSRSVLYEMPSDILFALNETAIVTENLKTRLITIVPISFEEYARILSKPYKQPLKNQGWRLLNTGMNGTTQARISEIGTPTPGNITDYIIRYIRRPKPIILIDLKSEYDDDMTIDGESSISTCELDPEIHSEIIQRAVELARITYMGDVS